MRKPPLRRLRLSPQAGIELTVSDDGRGMPEQHGDDTIGIEGMRERALLAGGTLEIESRPGQGTCVTLRVPRRGSLMPVPFTTRILLADDHELVRVRASRWCSTLSRT